MQELSSTEIKSNIAKNWTNILFFTLLPLTTVVFLVIYYWNFEVHLGIWGFALIFAVLTNLSITTAYHRLFAHRSFEAHPVVRAIFLLIGASAWQGSALVWCSDHRRHHNKMDTESDPYSITGGFWHAHMGWLFKKDPHEEIKATDLEADWAVAFQHKYFYSLGIIMGFLFPWAVGFLFGAPLEGLLIAGALRIVLTQQSTFFVNSLAHYWGAKPYADISARDNLLVAFLTHGEGYHNFHHRFQTDYRNGILWYQWDPTKWTIQSLSWMGLAKNLRTISQQEILKARLNMDSMRLKARGVQQEKFQQLKERILVAQERLRYLAKEYQSLKKQKNEALQVKVAEIKFEMKLLKIELEASLRQWKMVVASSRVLA